VHRTSVMCRLGMNQFAGGWRGLGRMVPVSGGSWCSGRRWGVRGVRGMLGESAAAAAAPPSARCSGETVVRGRLLAWSCSRRGGGRHHRLHAAPVNAPAEGLPPGRGGLGAALGWRFSCAGEAVQPPPFYGEPAAHAGLRRCSCSLTARSPWLPSRTHHQRSAGRCPAKRKRCNR